MPTPTVLFYTPQALPWSGKLPQLCAIQGLRLRVLKKEDLDQTISALVRGIPCAQVLPQRDDLPEPLMVFCHLPEQKLDRALQALGRQRAICLKAVLTPSNAGWSFRALYNEIARERAEMQQSGN